MITFDPLILARIQFAFTVSFHIIFPSLSIGLASFLAVLEWRLLRTKDHHFCDLYQFWVKIFAVAFGMGVVSGVVMAYQFGTNWSQFSYSVSNVLGPLLGFEVMTAFFLEASFLGIMLFGWGRVSERMHFTATIIVAIGTIISAFWILAANSWMQTPQGYTIEGSHHFFPENWLQIIFNPSFPFRFPHMVIGAFLGTTFLVGGVGAFYLLKGKHEAYAKIMVAMATLMATVVAPIQLFVGDSHGLNTLIHQPAKIAAIEAIWNTEKGVPFTLFAIPNQETKHNDYAITIPHAASLILTHEYDGELKGLNEFGENIPPVLPVFFAFRVMVGLGLLMILIGITSTIQYFRQRLFTSRWLLACWVLMTPAGIIAVLSGWMVTEIGRQPFTVYGLVKTLDSVTPALLGPEVAWSLASFVCIYTLIFGAGAYYIIKIILKEGVIDSSQQNAYYNNSMSASIIETVTVKKGN